MIESTRSMVSRALCLGIAGGFRSLPPLGALALTCDRVWVKGGWRRWPVFNNRLGRGLPIAGSAAEFVTDKLTWTQSRLALNVQPSCWAVQPLSPSPEQRSEPSMEGSGP